MQISGNRPDYLATPFTTFAPKGKAENPTKLLIPCPVISSVSKKIIQLFYGDKKVSKLFFFFNVDELLKIVCGKCP